MRPSPHRLLLRRVAAACLAATAIGLLGLAAPAAAQTILVLSEQCGGSTAHYPTAITNHGFTATVTGNDASFNAALTGGTSWDLVIVDEYSNALSASTVSALQSYIAGGGRAAVDYWDWTNQAGLGSSLGGVFFLDYTTPLEIDALGAQTLFTTPNSVPNLVPTANTCATDGAAFLPLGGTQSVAVYSPPFPFDFAILVANSERTVLFGGIPGLFNGDSDGDGKADGLEMAENIVDFLTPVDLQLSISDAPDPVSAGNNVTYTLQVTNAGPVGASNVKVSDALAGLVTGVSSTGCAEPVGYPTCTLGAIAAGASKSYTLTFTVSPAQVGSLLDTATVTSSNRETNSANNSDSEVTTVQVVTDLGITKTDGQTVAVPGTALVYTIVASNAGPSNAVGAVVTDAFPTALLAPVWTCVGSGGGTCLGGGLGTIASAVNLPVGASVTYSVTGLVDPAGSGTLSNTASIVVGAGATDPVSSNNSATDTDTLSPESDVRVVKSDGQATAYAGEGITYTVAVDNLGPSNVSGVSVSDVFPSALDAVAWICAPAAGTTCGAGGAGNISDSLTLPAGTGVLYTVTATLDPSASGTLTNTAAATVPSGTIDPVPSNNSSTDSDTVLRKADLALTKTDLSDPVNAGSSLAYVLRVTNGGPSNATGADVTDVLPSQVTYVSASPSQGSCTQSSGTLFCALGPLAAQAAATVLVNVTVSPTASGTISNTASVASVGSDVDPVAGNNSATATTTVNGLADLAVTLADSPDPAQPGNTLTYTLGASNAGPGSASGTTTTLTLPAGVSFVSATPSQGSCGQAAGVVTCALGTLAPSAAASVTVVVTIGAATSGTITASAAVSATQADPNAANNAASAATTVSPSIDLAVTKTGLPDPVVVGGSLLYTLTVSNNGPFAAAAVVLTDTLPSQVTYVSATPSVGSCSSGSGVVLCQLGTLVANASATVSLQVTVGSQAGATLVNTATVTGAGTDTNPANNTATATTTVNVQADLAATLADSPDPAQPGNTLTYTLGASSAGPATATGVTATVTLPAGVTFVSATPSQGSCGQAAGVVTCPLGTFAPGGSASVSIVVTIGAATSGTITATAALSATQSDPNAANNSASATTTVNPPIDLALTKTGLPDPVAVGGTLLYSLTATNNGPFAAASVQLTDTLPSAVSLVSATPSAGSCSSGSGVVVCQLGTLAANASATLSLQVTVGSQASGTLSNTATVTGAGTDTNLGNNSATDLTTVTLVADLAVAQSDSPDPASTGDSVTYAIEVSNAGPSDATGVVLTDTLPAGVSFTSATPSQGSCSQAAGTVTCNLGTLASGGQPASITLLVAVTSTSSQTVTNLASVAPGAGITDPSTANNSDSETTTLNPPVDLALTKTAPAGPLAVGASLLYTLGVSNLGPSSSANVTLTDTLPSGVSFVSATPGQGSCASGGSTVTCLLGSLGAGASTTVLINVTVGAGASSTLVNQASVTGTGSDTNPANNSASASTAVSVQADLAITKTASPSSVGAGGSVTYTLTVTNNGPSNASGVTVVDDLPAGVTVATLPSACNGLTPLFSDGFETGNVSRWSTSLGAALARPKTSGGGGGRLPAAASQQLTCHLGSLAAGASVQLVLHATVGADAAAGSLTNVAAVSGSATDPVTTNNSASASTGVSRRADLALTNVDSPDPVAPGAVLTYLLTVSNGGPSSATGITLSDNPPPETTYLSAVASQGSCSYSGGLTCNLGSLALAGTATVTLRVRVAATATVALTNPAAVFGTETDLNPVNNSATAVTTVTGSSILADRAPAGSPQPPPEIPTLAGAGLAALALLLAAVALLQVRRRSRRSA